MKRASPKPGPRVHLDIDALQLHGFSDEARGALVTALQQELERLIDERGVPGASPGHLHLDRLRVDCANSNHHHAGRDAARTLFGHLRLQAAGGAVEPHPPSASPGAKP